MRKLCDFFSKRLKIIITIKVNLALISFVTKIKPRIPAMSAPKPRSQNTVCDASGKRVKMMFFKKKKKVFT